MGNKIPQAFFKYQIPEQIFNKMKDAIKKSSNKESIGPITGNEMFEKNKTLDSEDTMFKKIIESKIRNDFETIKDGLTLLEEYLKLNPNIDEFDFNIKNIANIRNYYKGV